MRWFLITSTFILALIIGIGNLPTISANETTISNGQTIRNQWCFASDCFFPANLWGEQISSYVGTKYLLAADNGNDEDTGEKKDTTPEPPDRIANSVCYG